MSEQSSSDGRPVSAQARWTPWLVAGAYLVLVVCFWGWYVFDRGLHGDTIYVELSQTRSWFDGFFYPYDRTRQGISFAFHLAYLLSNGSYLSLHLLFGLFVWLTGLLTYRLVKSFFPDAEFLAFASGAIALTHGGDDFGNLVSVIMVRQAVVGVLLAVLLLRVGWIQRRPLLLIPIAVAQFSSLWTYEAGLLMLVCAPVLIMSAGMSWPRFLRWSAAWSVLPFLNIGSMVYRYKVLNEVSYQSAQLADRIDLPFTAQRLWDFSAHGVLFWRWAVRWMGPQGGCVADNLRDFGVPIAIGAVSFLACGGAVAWIERRRGTPVPWARALLAAGFFMALSYGPYLALKPENASPFWRTQFFAAPAAAIFLAAFAGLLDHVLRARRVIALLICGAAVGTGTYAGLSGQLEQTRRWEPYRDVMAGIVAAAPRIKDDTLVTLVGTPPAYFHTLCENPPVPNPPFEDQMWFNSALQVLYPNTRLVGLFWWSDGTSPGSSIKFDFGPSGAKMNKTNVGLDGNEFGYDQMLAFQWDAERGAVLLPVFPSALIRGSVNPDNYDAAARILPGPAPVETLRKLAR